MTLNALWLPYNIQLTHSNYIRWMCRIMNFKLNFEPIAKYYIASQLLCVQCVRTCVYMCVCACVCVCVFVTALFGCYHGDLVTIRNLFTHPSPLTLYYYISVTPDLLLGLHLPEFLSAISYNQH